MQGLLLCYAAPAEGAALADLGAVALGVGKAAAAASLAARLAVQRPDAVLLFGVCGAFPGRHRPQPAPLGPGDLCVVGSDRFGDEGVQCPDGFRDLAELGLGATGPFAADPAWATRAAAILKVSVVDGCTVSTCSGTEATSQTMAARTGAAVESMEGAAVALVCGQLQVPWLQVRCVSNWTGDRNRGEWDLPSAAAAVQAAVRRLIAAG